MWQCAHCLVAGREEGLHLDNGQTCLVCGGARSRTCAELSPEDLEARLQRWLKQQRQGRMAGEGEDGEEMGDEEDEETGEEVEPSEYEKQRLANIRSAPEPHLPNESIRFLFLTL